MKLELILFFVVACMAQEEELDLDDYPLLKDYFWDWATLRHLGGHLYKDGLIGCYLMVKGNLEEIATNFKINLTKAESITRSVAGSYQTVTYFLIETLKEISGKIKSCQIKIWEEISNSRNSEVVDVISECRSQISNLFGCYDSQLNIIQDTNSKAKVKNKLGEIINQTEEELKKINKSFEKCVLNPPSSD